MTTRVKFTFTAALVCVGLLAVLTKSRWVAVKATTAWPQRPVRIIITLGPGSALDLAARLFAERLAERWGKPVLVENRAGADGIVGVSAFLSAEPSETLLFAPSAPYVLNAYIYKSLPYEAQRDLVPLSSGTRPTGVIAVSATLSVTSLRELIVMARERPGQIYWTATPGFAELGFSAFLKGERLEMMFVPYKDATTPLQDLAQGRIHVMVTGLSTLGPQVTAGKARVLAVQNSNRSPAAPDVPTVAEAGYPGISFYPLFGFYGRSELPVALREKISAEIQNVGKNPELSARLAAMGQEVHVGTPEAFSAELEQSRATAARVIAALELKPR